MMRTDYSNLMAYWRKIAGEWDVPAAVALRGAAGIVERLLLERDSARRDEYVRIQNALQHLGTTYLRTKASQSLEILQECIDALSRVQPPVPPETERLLAGFRLGPTPDEDFARGHRLIREIETMTPICMAYGIKAAEHLLTLVNDWHAVTRLGK